MFETIAQLTVEEPQNLQNGAIQLIPISSPVEMENVHFPAPSHGEGPEGISFEVQDQAPHGGEEDPLTVHVNLIEEINVEDGSLLGAPGFDPHKAKQEEEAISVTEEDFKNKEEKDEKDADDNEARKGKKSEKWDWEAKGATGFLSWIKERINTVPKHSGYDTAGLERAVSYLERLDSEISKAMRLDLEGELDADQIEHVRSQLEKGLDMLFDRIDKVKASKKKAKKGKKKADDQSSSLVKEAQKITGVQGIYVTVPLLISRVARVCINGMVSAGHDIEDLYARQVKKYKLTDREQAETMQLLADMGYALRQDRGFMPEDDLEVEDGMDWNQNFKG
jgi:hypothetical protein